MRHNIVRRFALNGVGRCSICDAVVRDGQQGCPGVPIVVDGKEPPPPPAPTSAEGLAYLRWESSLGRGRVGKG